MGKYDYYECCFYHDEDDNLASKNRCSYCIKTEIPAAPKPEAALRILFGEHPLPEHQNLISHLTAVLPIPKTTALSCYDMEGLDIRVESEDGVYYTRESR